MHLRQFKQHNAECQLSIQYAPSIYEYLSPFHTTTNTHKRHNIWMPCIICEKSLQFQLRYNVPATFPTDVSLLSTFLWPTTEIRYIPHTRLCIWLGVHLHQRPTAIKSAGRVFQDTGKFPAGSWGEWYVDGFSLKTYSLFRLNLIRKQNFFCMLISWCEAHVRVCQLFQQFSNTIWAFVQFTWPFLAASDALSSRWKEINSISSEYLLWFRAVSQQNCDIERVHHVNPAGQVFIWHTLWTQSIPRWQLNPYQMYLQCRPLASWTQMVRMYHCCFNLVLSCKWFVVFFVSLSKWSPKCQMGAND